MTDIVARLRADYEQLRGLNNDLLADCAKAEAANELLRQEVLTLRGMQQGYRDEIVEHFREIERLKVEINQMKLNMRPCGEP